MPCIKLICESLSGKGLYMSRYETNNLNRVYYTRRYYSPSSSSANTFHLETLAADGCISSRSPPHCRPPTCEDSLPATLPSPASSRRLHSENSRKKESFRQTRLLISSTQRRFVSCCRRLLLFRRPAHPVFVSFRRVFPGVGC